jgi:hypothetical protein
MIKKNLIEKFFIRKIIIKIAPLLLLSITAIVGIVAEFRQPKYDYDIDHMLYYGTRLWQGELLWTKEYEDKLPFVQLMFALPSYFKSLHVWQLISLISILIAAYSISVFVDVILLKDKLNLKINIILIKIFSGISYVYLIVFLPGSITHINGLAISFFITAMTIEFCTSKIIRGTKIDISFSTIVAVLFMAIAVSVRPYLILASIWIFIWSIHEKITVENNDVQIKIYSRYIKSIFLYMLKILVLLIIFIILINFSHYFYEGKAADLTNGIIMLSEKSTPSSILGTLKMELFTVGMLNGGLFLFFAIYFLIVIEEIINLFKYPITNTIKKLMQNKEINLLILCILIEAMILTKHFWDHYLQLFAPFIILSISSILIRINIKNLNYKIIINENLNSSLLIYLLPSIFTFSLLHKDFLNSFKYIIQPNISQKRELLETIKSFSDTSILLQQPFLFPTEMYSHWILNESRHGFPHAANIAHINHGWWESIKNPIILDLPKSSMEYCSFLLKNGPKTIFIKYDIVTITCLESKENRVYKQMITSETKFIEEKYNYRIYLR